MRCRLPAPSKWPTKKSKPHVMRKWRAAPGGQHERRRFGARDERLGGADASGAPVAPGSPEGEAGPHEDPLDPFDPAPDDGPARRSSFSRSSSTSASKRAGRSQQPARSLKARAIDYLSRREHSRAELTRKLAPFVEEGDALDPLLDVLEREGWLSNERFAESVLNRRSSRMGANRIVSELRQHKLDDTLIESVGAQLRDTERARAQAVWRKKFGQLPQSSAERAKQARFLAMRGFSQATISQILKGGDDWNDD